MGERGDDSDGYKMTNTIADLLRKVAVLKGDDQVAEMTAGKARERMQMRIDAIDRTAKSLSSVLSSVASAKNTVLVRKMSSFLERSAALQPKDE